MIEHSAGTNYNAIDKSQNRKLGTGLVQYIRKMSPVYTFWLLVLLITNVKTEARSESTNLLFDILLDYIRWITDNYQESHYLNE